MPPLTIKFNSFLNNYFFSLNPRARHHIKLLSIAAQAGSYADIHAVEININKPLFARSNINGHYRKNKEITLSAEYRLFFC